MRGIITVTDLHVKPTEKYVNVLPWCYRQKTYVIRRKTDNLYFVLSDNGYEKGQTRREPGLGVIRFYNQLWSAKLSLKWWLEGKTYVTYPTDYYGEVECEEWETISIPSRKKEDMQIVLIDFDETEMKVVWDGEKDDF